MSASNIILIMLAIAGFIFISVIYCREDTSDFVRGCAHIALSLVPIIVIIFCIRSSINGITSNTTSYKKANNEEPVDIAYLMHIDPPENKYYLEYKDGVYHYKVFKTSVSATLDYEIEDQDNVEIVYDNGNNPKLETYKFYRNKFLTQDFYYVYTFYLPEGTFNNCQ